MAHKPSNIECAMKVTKQRETKKKLKIQQHTGNNKKPNVSTQTRTRKNHMNHADKR